MTYYTQQDLQRWEQRKYHDFDKSYRLLTGKYAGRQCEIMTCNDPSTQCEEELQYTVFLDLGQRRGDIIVVKESDLEEI